MIKQQTLLMRSVPHDISPLNVQRLLAGKGLMEEVHEYLNSVGVKPWRPKELDRPHQLEEITDILFFYLELIVMSGFEWSDIEKEYDRKWQENMERYKRGKVGDYGWDTRATKDEL